MTTEKVMVIEEELANLVHRLDLAEHNDSLGMAPTIKALYGQVADKKRELEAAQAEDDG